MTQPITPEQVRLEGAVLEQITKRELQHLELLERVRDTAVDLLPYLNEMIPKYPTSNKRITAAQLRYADFRKAITDVIDAEGNPE